MEASTGTSCAAGAPWESMHVLENIKVSSSRAKIVIGLGSVKLGPIFRWCREQERLGIVEDYSLGEPTLEQVFLEFAKQQEACDRREEGAT